jgi:hypothetical protein
MSWTLTMHAWSLTVMVTVADSNHFDEDQDLDPHQRENSDLDPNQNEKREPDPDAYQNEKSDN